jgi:hypothetical protein
MDIIANFGIGPLHFGMKPAEILKLFPEEQKWEFWMGGNRNDSLFFHGILLEFDKCNSTGPLPDSRLTELEVFGREDATLWGQNIIDWTEKAIVEYIHRNDIPCEVVASGGFYLPTQSMAFSFDEGQLFIEAWIDRKSLLAMKNERWSFFKRT